jgi:hypothetical protein
MSSFEVRIDKLQIHDHSPTAHRAVIGAALDQVKQAVGGGVLTRGDITTPPHVVIGSWEIVER